MKKILAFILILFSCLQGCSTLSNSLSSDQARKKELEVLNAKIAKSYLWKSYNEVLKYMLEPDDNQGRELAKLYKDFRISEVNVDQVNYEEENTRAFVVLEIKAFSPPKYVLETHYDQIEWRFSALNDGWKIVKIDLGKSN